MGNFADHLREARERAGLNQTELAARAGLTGSYISLLESGRKPPPSDRVLSRLARALDIPEAALVEIAHLDRTPEDVRRRILALSHHLERERRVTHGMLAQWFTLPSLFGSLLKASDPLISRARLGGKKRRILEKVLRHLAPIAERKDFEGAVREYLGRLPDEEREVLAEALPEVLALKPSAPATASEPLVLCSPPSRGEAVAPYLLRVEGDEMLPRIEPGDVLLVDPGAEPRPGDLAVLTIDGRTALRQIAATGRRLSLVAANPRVPPGETDPAGVLGVIVEIRRRLR